MVKIITIDGPAGVGKGAISKVLSKFLNANVLNSGEIYRSIAYKMCLEGVDYKNKLSVIRFIKSYKYKTISTNKLYSKKIDTITSEISTISEVRKGIINLQHNFINQKSGQNNTVIAEGRDMGSKIFPDAQTKIFLWANSEVRAKRRYLQVRKGEKNRKFDDILVDIIARDMRDMNRKVAPLHPAADSYLIDNSNLDIEQCSNKILKIIKR
ncbi:(d)CMP kinase [Pelagibacteraceae bacterium]|nr:(d)CMP kinase [Pelagibacteraceae bacterium]